MTINIVLHSVKDKGKMIKSLSVYDFAYLFTLWIGCVIS